IANQIKKHRVESKSKCANTSTLKNTSESSKDALIAALKARVKELEIDNLEQKKTIEMLYGKLHDST
ncbi:hypothetical protein VXN68_14505, partial [Acinetobacter schindleri]